MDIRVQVEDIIREVGGINDSTTCEEIIIKLAQASNLPGFYMLVAICLGHEVTLSADQKISEFIRRTKEKPEAIQFVLRRLEAPPRSAHTRLNTTNNVNRGIGLVSLDNGQGLETMPSVSRDSSVTLTSNLINKPPGITRNVVEQDEYEQLEDRLAYQEREVELNRIRLFQLDKEIAELERSNRVNGCVEPAIGPAAELAQLSATPWSQMLENNRARQADLLEERERYQSSLNRVNQNIEISQNKLSELQTKVTEGLDRLLVTLDAANVQRRQFLRSLSPNTVRPKPSTSTDGVPV